jgi:hypothetical protein
MLGVKEVTGPKDHPFAVLGHILTGIVNDFRQTFIDEIPWCSSGMTLVLLMTMMKLNPNVTIAALRKRKIPDPIILWVRDYAGVPDEELRDTGFPLVLPTFNASADSYFTWGVEVDRQAWMKGLVAGLTRDGGNHVSDLEGWESDLILTGCNQSNSICTSDSYDWDRLRAVRAAAI